MKVVEIAQGLVNGTVLIPPHGPIAVAHPIKWHEIQAGDKNLAFQLHSLRWARPLLSAYEETSDRVFIDRWDQIFQDWYRQFGSAKDYIPFRKYEKFLSVLTAGRLSNLLGRRGYDSRIAAHKGNAWSDHEVAFRSIEIAKRIQLLLPPPRLRGCLEDHLGMLIRSDFFRPRSNHGVNQLRGLIASATVLNRPRYLDLATQRFREYLYKNVDEYGVLIEQSTAYQIYARVVLGRFVEEYLASGLELPDDLQEKIDLMAWLQFCAVAPDGSDICVGDGEVGRDEAPQEKAFLQPSIAPTHDVRTTPKLRVDHFPENFIMVRDLASGEELSERHRFHLAIALQPRRSGHGHDDAGALNLAMNGRRLILPSGKYRYGTSERRKFVRSRQSQNSIQIDGFELRIRRLKKLNIDVKEAMVDIQLWFATNRGEWFRRFQAFVVENRVRVTDHFKGEFWTQYRSLPGVCRYEPFAARLETTAGTLEIAPCESEPAAVELYEGEADSMLGWYSPRYGEWCPASTIRHHWRDHAVVDISLQTPG